MKLISRIKIGYKKSGIMMKIGYLLAFFAIILTIGIFIYQTVGGGKSEKNIIDEGKISENNITEILFTQKLSEWNVTNCSDVVEGIGNKFPALNCAKSKESEYSNKPELCESNLTVKNGAFLIDNCDIAYKKLKLSDSGYAIGINFKPIWNLYQNSSHYLFDIINGNDSERNRISLYTQNGFLKYSISNKYGTEEHLIKIDLKNDSGWKEQNFNKIEIGWFGDRMFVDLNGNNNNKVVGNIDLNLDDSYLFLGSNVFGNDQAIGYFDYIYVRNYVYPEPSWASLGPEQTVNK